MRTIQNGSQHIAYDVRGEGAAAILFNHSGASGLAWSERFLEALAAKLTVVSFDYRGTGHSSAPSRAFLLSDLAADGQSVLEAEGIGSVIVIGTSMGGAVAQEFALAFPQRVAILVLIGTAKGQKHMVPPGASVLDTLKSLSDARSPMERMRRMLPTIYSAAYLEQHADLALELELKGARFTTDATIASHGAAMRAFEAHERLPSISAPTLVIHGAEDPIIPVQNGRILAGRIPGSEYVELEGVGHLPAVERPFEIADHILQFARRHEVTA